MVIRFPCLPLPAAQTCALVFIVHGHCHSRGPIPALSATTSFFFLSGGGTLVDKEGFSLNPLSQRKHGASPFIFPTSFRTSLCYLYLPSVIFQVSFSLRFVFFARSHTVFTGSVSSLSPFRPLQFGPHPLVFPEICIRMVPGGVLVDKACDVFSAPAGPPVAPLCYSSPPPWACWLPKLLWQCIFPVLLELGFSSNPAPPFLLASVAFFLF